MRYVEGPKARELKREFFKWAEAHREVFFDGKDDVGQYVEWRETLEFYFSTTPITNECLQAWLATHTFRRTVMRWWGSKTKQYPRLIVSFSQLLEWVRTELVPEADPEEAHNAWQKLAYRGDVEDYLRQYDKLTLYFPLPHQSILSQATQPLGSAFKASAKRVDMQHGKSGMTLKELRLYIELYLREMSPADSRRLAESSMIRGGYGKMSKPTKGAAHAMNIRASWEDAPEEDL